MSEILAPDPHETNRFLNMTDRDELDAAVLVARAVSGPIDMRDIRRQIDDLRDQFVAAVPEGATAATLAKFLGACGFAAADNLQSVEPSRIDWVLANRRGIPITLSVVYVMVGRALGVRTRGVNFPHHFLLRADDQLIDPMTADLLTQADIERWLREANLAHLGDSALALASPDDIAVRMFNNVKAIYAARGDIVGALALIDCQLPIVADAGALHLERAELWFRLGNTTAAAAVLEGVREQFVGTRWEVEIDKRLRRLGSQPRSTIH
jgi:regulator of sirC expression with transglutaminase-like and TPR domain